MIERTIEASSPSLGELADERAVDLDLAHRQPLEHEHRRVAGAEVVQAELDVERLEGDQRVHDPGVLGHQGALGELQLEQRRRDPVPGQRLGHRAGELAAVQVAGGDVDRDGDGQALGPPLRHLRERGVDDELGEPVHEPRGLGERDELVGRDEAAGRVVPAQQRLDADHVCRRWPTSPMVTLGW